MLGDILARLSDEQRARSKRFSVRWTPPAAVRASGRRWVDLAAHVTQTVQRYTHETDEEWVTCNGRAIAHTRLA